MNRFLLLFLRNIFRLPFICGKLCHYAKRVDRYPQSQIWGYIGRVMKLIVRTANVRLEVSGVENIPEDGGFMLYGNHQGIFDVMAIGSTCPRPLSAVYKKELSTVPMMDKVYACTRSLAMDREDVRQSLTVIQQVTEAVKEGRGFLIFPEGTRSKRTNEMGEFHAGSFRCAVKAKCPIVPFALIDCYKVLDQKGCTKFTVQLHYLPVIPYEEFKDLKSVAVAQLVKARIQEAIDQNT